MREHEEWVKIRDALERARRIRESRDVDESGSRKVNE